MYEEKLMAEEGLKKTKNDLIHIGCPIPFDIEEFLEQLDGLLGAAYKNKDDIKERVQKAILCHNADMTLVQVLYKPWKVLRPYRMKLLRLAPAKFIHFGTTKEILALMCGGVEQYDSLGWSSRVASSISGSTAGYNSVLSSRASVGKDCYLEVSY